ncbi:tetratricopeptide repeat-containing sensor histidine kinase [Cyclobacterium plantarum]|uniref:tetratricopeptide repeat-containing sensor histidine kinase n=1 Tax=Cyclobacterium plantarum TaxID=2716263 RepID=UPI003F6EC2D1
MMDREEFAAAIELLTMLTRHADWVEEADNARMAFNNLGYSHYLLQEYMESAQNYERATRMARQLQDTVKWIGSQTSLAMAYRQLGMYARSLEANQEALQLAKIRQDWKIVLDLLNAGGILYQNLEKWDFALEKHREALNVLRIRPDPPMQAYLYTNLAISHAGLGLQDSSLYYNLRSLQLKEELGMEATEKASNLNNIGENYLALDSLNQASRYLLQANALYVEKGDKEGMVENYNNLAKLSLKSDQTQQAAAYLKKVGTLLEEVPVKELFLDYLSLRTSLLEREGRHAEALRTHKELAAVRQEVFQTEQLAVQRLEARALLREKNLEAQNLLQEAALARAESKKNAQLMLFLLAGLVLAALVSFFFIRLNRRLKESNQLIALQKLEIKHHSFNLLMRLQSLLRMTSDSLEDPATQEKLQQVEAAIIAAASLQQFSYGIENEEEVSLGKFLQELVERLKEAFSNPANPPIAYSVELKTEVVLPVKTVLNCGLMVAEIVTNSIKHAAHGVENPKISLCLSRFDNYILLQVEDNGQGSKGNTRQSGVGQGLISRLARFIQAELTVTTEGGTCYLIKIKG